MVRWPWIFFQKAWKFLYIVKNYSLVLVTNYRPVILCWFISPHICEIRWLPINFKGNGGNWPPLFPLRGWMHAYNGGSRVNTVDYFSHIRIWFWNYGIRRILPESSKSDSNSCKHSLSVHTNHAIPYRIPYYKACNIYWRIQDIGHFACERGFPLFRNHSDILLGDLSTHSFSTSK